MPLILCSCSNNNEVNDKIIVENVTCSEKDKLLKEGAILIDVRSSIEYDSGYLEGAINIPVETIESEIEEKVKDENTKIILYCRSGSRSSTAAQILVDMGYKNVYDLGGNYLELTLEATDQYRIGRGYNYGGSLSGRGQQNPTNAYGDSGSRLALYIV